MLGYDPDSTDVIPADRAALSSYACSTESSPWSINTLDCKLSDTAKWYYNDVLSTGSSTNYAGALIDQGQVFAATWGGPDFNTVGEIYVLYDVELKDPQPNAGNLAQSYGNAATVALSFPSNFPLFASGGTSNSVAVQCYTPGTYFITLQCQATASSAATITEGIILKDGINLSASNAVHILWVQVTGISTITFPGLTGLAHWTLWATKTTPQVTYEY
jgi:hypothetical protein